MLKAIIMAGGRGERFWPMSTESVPKQCLKIVSDKTMVEETVDRLKPLFPRENIYIVTNGDLAKSMKDYVPEVNFVVEPCAKNTAACIGLSAIELDDDDIMFVETTDHVYKDVDAYIEHIKAAVKVAEEDKICLIGILPTHAHTGLGYIKQGEQIKKDKIQVFGVDSFKEKPDLKTAEEYVASNEYLWNSGMFIAKAKMMLDAIHEYMPDLHRALMNIKEDKKSAAKEFDKLESVSIDYGIMEKKKDLAVVRAKMHWDDVGDWQAMERVHEADKDGNVAKVEHYSVDSKNNIIFGDKMVATLGVNDLVIVNTKDAVLVCGKGRAQELKELVKQLPEKYLK